MYKALSVVNMIATIVNATINLSKALVALTTRKHKYDIELGINIDYKSDLHMLLDVIKKWYFKVKNFVMNNIIITGYLVEISIALLFISLNINLIYLEIVGLVFLAYRLYIYIMDKYYSRRQLLLAY